MYKTETEREIKEGKNKKQRNVRENEVGRKIRRRKKQTRVSRSDLQKYISDPLDTKK
jgi:hypothetical protein